jgi:tRNA threonylcarbamoyladenosine biosynthesis protein TsaE
MDGSFISGSPEETVEIGRIIGEILMPGDVVALIGDLGAGKTCLAQGIARGLGVSERYHITSPTFTLINEYPGRIPLIHLDIYRLQGAGDLAELGYEEYFYGDGVAVVEWAEKIKDILPGDTMFINLNHVDENQREIRISGRSGKIGIIAEELRRKGFG